MSPVVTRQGHWHVEYIRPVARGRGFRAWEIGTEQKRPWVEGYMTAYSTLFIDVESRPEGWGPSLYFRDGEDGSVPTQVRLMRIPRQAAWVKWVKRHVLRRQYVADPVWTVAVSVDKYAVHVAAIRI